MFLQFGPTLYALHFVIESDDGLQLKIGANYKDLISKGLEGSHGDLFLERFSFFFRFRKRGPLNDLSLLHQLHRFQPIRKLNRKVW